jgi:molybdopterin synthase sulfur carrier subunit
MVTTATIRVRLPYHLRNLARVSGEVKLDMSAPITIRSALDALEQRYPMLKGTIRDHETLQRRAYLRFYACGRDYSLDPQETPLPDRVVSGDEPLIVLGAIAGG